MIRTPTLAMMITRFDGWYQGQLWHGAMAAAKLHRARLVCLVGDQIGMDGSDGTEVIYRMAMRREFDGYLPAVGVLANSAGEKYAADWFAEFPVRPTVCIGQELAGLDAVVPQGGGTDLALRHLIEIHGCRRIAYLAGPERNPDAKRRLEDYRRTLESCGIEYDPDLVGIGHFDAERGREALRAILMLGPIDAVVAGNDGMAIGAYQVLAEMGLRVPTQVKVIGYDDIDECRAMSPTLSTVRANTYSVAYRAVERLLSILRTPQPPQLDVLPMELVIRKSCGCIQGSETASWPDILVQAQAQPSTLAMARWLADPEHAEANARELQAALQDATESEIETWELSFQAASRQVRSRCDHAGRDRIEEVMDQFRDLLREQRTAFEHRKIMTNEIMTMDLQQVSRLLFSDLEPEHFLERMVAALSVWRGCRMRILLYDAEYSPVATPDLSGNVFDSCLEVRDGTIRKLEPGEAILPEDDVEPGIWSFHDLNHRHLHFGVLQVRGWQGSESTLMSLSILLAAAFEGSARFANELRLKARLVLLSHGDEMTGILNRRGFLSNGAILANLARRDGHGVGLVFCDLNGLKTINDKYGHADGDLAIRALAQALEASFRKSDVVARLGGDEFVVAARLLHPGDSLEPAIVRLHRELAKCSALLGRPWEAKTSAGWIRWEPSDGQSLETAMAAADANLYADKRRQKSAQAPSSPEAAGG